MVSSVSGVSHRINVRHPGLDIFLQMFNENGLKTINETCVRLKCDRGLF